MPRQEIAQENTIHVHVCTDETLCRSIPVRINRITAPDMNIGCSSETTSLRKL